MDDLTPVALVAHAREAYLQALTDLRGLAHSLQPEQLDLATDCPGWTVRDHVAHVGGLEAVLLGRPRPDHEPDWAALRHVRNDAGRFMEVDVDLRRRWTWAEVLAELDEVLAARLQEIATLPDDPEAQMLGPLGQPRPLLPTLPIRAFDVWQHDQDVRHAVGRPATLQGQPAALAVRQIRSALPYVLGKAVGAPAGTTVRWTVTGEQHQVIALGVGADGRAVEVDPVGLDPTVALTTDTETFTLLGAGRRAPTDVTVAVEGDADLAARLLAELAITP